MSELVQSAFETEAILLGNQTERMGLFSGGVLPHVAAPDAPFPSKYFRSNGEEYKLVAADASLQSNWILQEGSSGVLYLPVDKQTVLSKLPSARVAYLPVKTTDGSRRNLAVIDGQVFIQMHDGRIETLAAVA